MRSCRLIGVLPAVRRSGGLRQNVRIPGSGDTTAIWILWGPHNFRDSPCAPAPYCVRPAISSLRRPSSPRHGHPSHPSPSRSHQSRPSPSAATSLAPRLNRTERARLGVVPFVRPRVSSTSKAHSAVASTLSPVARARPPLLLWPEICPPNGQPARQS